MRTISKKYGFVYLLLEVFTATNNWNVETNRKKEEKKGIFWKLLSFAAADKAGEAIRDILKSDKLDIVEKTGADDLQTKADRYANDLLCASIKKAFPQINVIGEEGPVDLNNIKPEMLVEGTYLFKLRPFKFLH